MTTRRVATCCGVGLPLGNAEANREQGPRAAGMRPSARAEGSLRSNGEPAGLLLAGAAVGCLNCQGILNGNGMIVGVMHGH